VTEYIIGGVAVLVAAALWFLFRIGRPPVLTNAGQQKPPEGIGTDTARATIVAGRDADRDDIAADLEGADPAGRLAERANRNRNRRK
jgi:hypothetical protein